MGLVIRGELFPSVPGRLPFVLLAAVLCLCDPDSLSFPFLVFP